MPDGNVTGAARYNLIKLSFTQAVELQIVDIYVLQQGEGSNLRAFSCIVLESAIMSCLPRGFPTQRVFI